MPKGFRKLVSDSFGSGSIELSRRRCWPVGRNLIYFAGWPSALPYVMRTWKQLCPTPRRFEAPAPAVIGARSCLVRVLPLVTRQAILSSMNTVAEELAAAGPTQPGGASCWPCGPVVGAVSRLPPVVSSEFPFKAALKGTGKTGGRNPAVDDPHHPCAALANVGSGVPASTPRPLGRKRLSKPIGGRIGQAGTIR